MVDAVQERFSQALDQAIEQANPPAPTTLYHYTTPEACFAILHGKSSDGEPALWASSAFCMNDASEISYGLGVIGKVAEEFGRSKHHVIEQEMRYLETAMVVSFSSDPDLLSQWRAYARNGAGCAIGFHRDRLCSVAGKHGFRLLPVIYDPKVQRQILENYFEQVAEETDADWSRALATASLLALCFKDRGFHEEIEWRLAAPAPHEVMFRSGPSGVIPYTQLNLTKDCISEIWQGPTLDQQMAGRAWEFYLRTNFGEDDQGEPKVKLHSSTLPLRLL